jgi:hypothetical protein
VSIAGEAVRKYSVSLFWRENFNQSLPLGMPILLHHIGYRDHKEQGLPLERFAFIGYRE